MRRADQLALRSVHRCPSCGAWVTAPALMRTPHPCGRPSTERWEDHGNCRQVDTEAFYAEENRETVEFIKQKFCADCPVRDVCLAAALQRGEQGVWGGTTTHDRVLLARRVRAHARRTA